MKNLILIAKRAHVFMEVMQQAREVMMPNIQYALDNAIGTVLDIRKQADMGAALEKRLDACTEYDEHQAPHDELIAALEGMVRMFDQNAASLMVGSADRLAAFECATKALAKVGV